MNALKRYAFEIRHFGAPLMHPVWKVLYPRLHKPVYRSGSEYSDRKDAFSTHYELNLWDNPESRSGWGSTATYTRRLRKLLPPLLRRYRVGTLLDAPCGDYNWMSKIDLPDIDYIGADIVPNLIAELNLKYPVKDFRCLDLVRDPLPKIDMWLCRDLLIHITNEEGMMILRRSAEIAEYLLISTYPFVTENVDLAASGGARFVNLRKPPFSLPPPLEEIDDFVIPHPPRTLALWSREQLAKLPKI